MRIEGLSPGRITEQGHVRKSIKPEGKVPSFKETFETFLKDVNAAQKESSAAKESFLAGEITDVHQVMNKSQEAKVAFNMLVEIRNKVMDGYQEVLRIRL